jgi:N6-L-threonylcarbamoyladenine synthase
LKKTLEINDGAGGSTTMGKPDLVTVTRGPGMRSNLSTGLDFAKGLAVAWQVPLVGVNHMQAHALTPRLVSALEPNSSQALSPEFPFLSLLVSGGHTMLVHSKALTNHEMLAKTLDVGIGETMDKTARSILPPEDLAAGKGISNGPLLEKFVFPDEIDRYNYEAPRTRQAEIATRQSKWGWGYGPPLSQSRAMAFSFSGLEGMTSNSLSKSGEIISIEERLEMGKEVMRVAFEHLASRVIFALEHLRASKSQEKEVTTLVVSGGVAANKYLRHM